MFFSTLSLALTVLLILAIETQPRIVRQATLTPEHIARAKYIIDAHRNPLAIDQPTIVDILSKDADIVANYLTNHFAKGSAQIATANRSALVYFSPSIPLNLFNGYLNIEATLAQTAATADGTYWQPGLAGFYDTVFGISNNVLATKQPCHPQGLKFNKADSIITKRDHHHV